MNAAKTVDGLAGYLAEAQSWEADRASLRARSERRAWWVAGAGWTLALLAGVGLASLAPLKTVQPFVIRVDNSTGIVDVVPALGSSASMDETVTRFLLTHYVTVCERFSLPSAESDYEECGAFHGAERNQVWLAKWTPSNPDSPIHRYKDGSALRVRVKAVTFFERGNAVRDLAQVRYSVGLRKPGNSVEELKDYIASIQFAYGKPSDDARLRQWNPLGFRVLSFESVPEILPDPSVHDPLPDPATKAAVPSGASAAVPAPIAVGG